MTARDYYPDADTADAMERREHDEAYCPLCNGTGESASGRLVCRACGGSGWERPEHDTADRDQ